MIILLTNKIRINKVYHREPKFF